MIRPDEASIARAERELAKLPGAAQKAVAEALNRAAGAGRAEAIRRIRDRYAAKAGDLRKMMTLTTAKPDAPEVAILARSTSLSLGYFPHRPTAAGTGGPGRRPLRAEVLRGERKVVKGAFVVRVNSGLRIMARTGQKTSTGKDALKSLYSVPLASMLGAQSVREDVEQRALAVFDERLEHEIARRLGSRS